MIKKLSGPRQTTEDFKIFLMTLGMRLVDGPGEELEGPRGCIVSPRSVNGR